ncbi:MAG: amino acid permease C-terminal domain-containing protein [Flavobacteriales bacterium AspAUS03]
MIPILDAFFCLYLMKKIPVRTWIAFLIWIRVGLIIYFSYEYHNIFMNRNKETIP